VCDKEMSWPHHKGETHQPDWVVYVQDSEKFRLTNVIPERIIFVSRGITVCGNKMPTRCNRGFYCRSYCFLNMFRAPLCPSSGVQEYYTVVAACGIWSGLELRVMCPVCRMLQDPANRTHNPQLHTRPTTWKPQHQIPQTANTV